MDKLPISLCMIVKNEENMLDDCLRSVCGMVNEMIVVDTGSNDNTVEIAQKLGARVYFQEWNEDFAEARNKAIYYAKNPWIFQLDADEELAPKGHNWFYKTYPWAGKEGYLLAIDNLTKLEQNEVFTAHYAIRFFRNTSSINYKNKIHETVSLDWSKAGKGSARIIHKGYAINERKEKRKQRNLPLLKRELKKKPGDPSILANMALYYGSDHNYKKADEYAAIALQNNIKGPLRRHCLRFCMHQAVKSKDTKKLKMLAKITNKKEFPEVQYFSGLMKKDTADIAKAEKILENFLDHVSKLTLYEKREKVVIDNICSAHIELSKIYQKNNNLQEAEYQLNAAANKCPTRLNIKLQRISLLIRMKNFHKAMLISKQIREHIKITDNQRLRSIIPELERMEYQIRNAQNIDA